MNDPNGLVFHNGVYHLFFQYNPLGLDHGNMSWGHATSEDLHTWVEQPVAIRFDDRDDIFSGSVVFDEHNTSGLGTATQPPLVAIYTAATRDGTSQAQAVAFSIDDGDTWEKYNHNPVLDRGSAHFRDPKVIRYHGPTGNYWVMVAVEAERREVLFYRSDDLLTWTYLSTYGPAGAVGGVWECPDLFPLPREDDPEQTQWVLLISLNPGAPTGGSGTQYVVGDFDGTTFTPETPLPQLDQGDEELAQLNWLDRGTDCYAGVTFHGTDDRILIAWMNNWAYARELPAHGSRGMMTLPRRLTLAHVGGRPMLRQRVVAPEKREILVWDGPVAEEHGVSFPWPLVGCIDARITCDSADVRILLGHDENRDGGVLIRYEPRTGNLTLQRRAAPDGVASTLWTTQQFAVLPGEGSALDLRIWFDTHSIELTARNGLIVMTDLLGLRGNGETFSLEVDGGGLVRIDQLTVSAVSDDL